MLNKKIILMAILLISLLSLSAVSAADDAASDIATQSDDTVLEESIDDACLGDSESVELEASNEDALSATSGPSVDPPMRASFVNLNDDVNNGADEVYLYMDYDYVEDYDSGFENGVEINHSVTIYGNGHTIDGANKARIFDVPSTYTVTFRDINFVNGNTAYTGGAIAGPFPTTVTAINCTFTNNYAGENGGALCRVNATNCTFINNIAGKDGGAMFGGKATDCTFIDNYAGENGGAISNGNGRAVNCTFTGNSAKNGGALSYYDATNCTFTNNTASENGGAMYHYGAINCTFTANSADAGGAIASGYGIDCTFTSNEAGGGGAIYNGTGINCNFTANTAYAGGAIYDGNATNCTFTKNKVIDSGYGGAIYNPENYYYDSENYADNCAFINNTASHGGAMCAGSVTNCTFTGNKAWYSGGALEGARSIIDCNFTKNSADSFGGAIYSADETKNCIFSGNSALDCGGAIDGSGDIENCTFINNHASYGGAMRGCSAINCTFIVNTADEEGTNDICDTENVSSFIFIIPKFSASNLNTTYNSGAKFNFNLVDAGQKFNGVKTIISIYKNDGTFVKNYTAYSGNGWKVTLPAGTYKAVLSIPGSNVASVTKTIKVAKNPAKITASAVTATYKVNKYLVITLKDAKGNPLKGKVTVTLGTTKTYTTNSKGQVKINVANLVPKTYTATIKYAGTANYAAVTKKVKVVVKKATPKMTAKAKSFKVKVATKKYTITLKNNVNTVLKSTKVTLTVNKKTFTAKTNSKGVATFKITNLKKKGKYTATIKYAGSKYYNKLSKKATITVN